MWFNMVDKQSSKVGRIRIKAAYSLEGSFASRRSFVAKPPSRRLSGRFKDGLSARFRDGLASRFPAFTKVGADEARRGESPLEVEADEEVSSHGSADFENLSSGESHIDELVLLGITQPQNKLNRKFGIIYPSDPFKVWWDIIISIILFLSCFTTPLSLAFPELSALSAGYKWMEVVIDVMFGIDILVNFISATQNEEFQVNDNRKDIAKNYLKGWFTIDILAILPLEHLIESDANALIRVARIGKLYKLVKITRLVRLVKLIKHQGQLFDRLNDLFKVGQGVERLAFSAILFIMLCHFMACIWIFVADLNSDKHEVPDPEGGPSDHEDTNWLVAGGFSEFSIPQKYVISIYYTVTTISTVGYGDISGTNTFERIICIFLMIIGVFFFSFSSGTLTSIIANYDMIHQKFQDKQIILKKITKEYQLPPHLYQQVMSALKYNTQNDNHEINEFVESLPLTLKTKVNMCIYKGMYEKINFLSQMNELFITWICPLLKPRVVASQQYVYLDNDVIDSIYFLTRGTAGFVLKLKKNIVYIEINEGDDFGQVDLVQCSIDLKKDYRTDNEVFYNSDKLVRQFTVQALEKCELLTLSIADLVKMKHEFYEKYLELFEKSEIVLKRVLQQMLKVILQLKEEQTSKQKGARWKELHKTISKTGSMDDDENQSGDKEEQGSNLRFFDKHVTLYRLNNASLSSASSDEYKEPKGEEVKPPPKVRLSRKSLLLLPNSDKIVNPIEVDQKIGKSKDETDLKRLTFRKYTSMSSNQII